MVATLLIPDTLVLLCCTEFQPFPMLNLVQSFPYISLASLLAKTLLPSLVILYPCLKPEQEEVCWLRMVVHS